MKENTVHGIAVRSMRAEFRHSPNIRASFNFLLQQPQELAVRARDFNFVLMRIGQNLGDPTNFMKYKTHPHLEALIEDFPYNTHLPSVASIVGEAETSVEYRRWVARSVDWARSQFPAWAEAGYSRITTPATGVLMETYAEILGRRYGYGRLRPLAHA